MPTSQQGNRKKQLWKFILLSVILIIVGINLNFYQRESARWKGHPYPEAKKYLIKANMCLYYGHLLTSIPGINEKSLIMRPIKSLTDHYVEEAKRHIPDTDGEKELYWYLFKLNYIEKNAGGPILNRNDTYSIAEIKEILDEMWPMLEGIGTKDIKDQEFIEMRYAALSNMSQVYLLNQPIYYIDISAWKFDYPSLWKDEIIAERNQKIFHFLEKIEKLYAEKNSHVIQNGYRNTTKSVESINKRFQLVSGRILAHQIITGKYKVISDFCNPERDIHLQYYLSSRNFLMDVVRQPQTGEAQKEEINSFINKEIDKQLMHACENIAKGGLLR